ncbi:MAG: efflux RND transporter permease subunit [Emcibacteraceae bacterium]|nr:efflux RND transporter permease subunit [Emcibacteraceae bacterium]
MRNLIAWFAENSVAANLLMVLIIVGGVVSLPLLRTEVFPVVSSDEISVSVSYLGAGPAEVEQNITIPIEETLKGVANIRKMSSRSRRGSSSVTLQLEHGANIQIVMDEVQSRIDGIRAFPRDIEPPRVRHNIQNDDIIDVIISGDTDQKTLANVARRVKADLLALPDVTMIDIRGMPPTTISIEVSEFDLRRLGISMATVAKAISDSSVDISVGSIRNGRGALQIRAEGRAYYEEEFAEITLLQQSNGTRIKLGDIATIKDGVSERSFIFRSKGKPSIVMETQLSPGQDVLKLTSAVKNYLEVAQSTFPQGITVSTWRDDSVEFNQRLDMLISNSLSGLVLVFALLVLFLRLDLALWVTFGIAIAFSGSFMVMKLLDFSINQISLFGFLLVLGIVVDDAIVVGEGIHATQRRGRKGLKGAIFGAQSLSLPITLSVFTTILAVVPLLMFQSETGQQARDIAVVVTGALLFSLVECLLILPCHLSGTKHFELSYAWYQKFLTFQRKVAQWLIDFAKYKYKPFIEKCLRAKYLTAAVFFSVLILFTSAYVLGFIRSSFNPEIPSNILRYSVELSETAAEGTHEILHDRMVAAIGGPGGIEEEYEERTGLARNILFPNYSSFAFGNRIFMSLEMSSEAMAVIDAEEVMNGWQERVGEIPEAVEVTLQNSRNTGRRGGDLSFYISASADKDIEDAVEKIKLEMRDIQGLTQIYDGRDRQGQELRLSLKPEAEHYGLTLGTLSDQVRLGFYGRIVQRIPRDGETIDIHVRYPLEARQNLNALREMYIKTPDGGEIPFNMVAEMDYAPVLNSPERINGQNIIKVSARMNKNVVSPFEAYQYLENGIFIDLKNEVSGFAVIPDGQVEEQAIFFDEITFYLSLVLLAIYALLAIGLRSYVEPLIILTAVPFGFVGALIGHLIIDMPVSLYSFLGLFAASGVVINDNLVLVDCIKGLKKEGMKYTEAIAEGGRMRFRAIVLTSVTTFIGLLPIMLETSYQAIFIIPMVVSLTFGVLFATMITLILVPCLYDIKDGISEKLSFLKSTDDRGIGDDTKEVGAAE